jgi:hypothetical protein
VTPRGAWTALLLAALPLAGQSLRGVVDIHAHCDPDSLPRSIGAIGLARLARERGMRGLVLKNHYEPTASMAWLARKEAPGIELFGGIALNRAVGGVNAAAVERMTRVAGGYGRVVWMPTFDAENQVRVSGEKRPFVSVARDGRLLPETLAVLDEIAKGRLALATGHSSPPEALLLIREARRRGVDRIVVTHAMLSPVSMTLEQMKEAAAEGAYLEFVYNALIGPNKSASFADYARAIRAAGVERAILSSDLGQAGNPLHPDGLAAFLEGMRKQGFTQEELDAMSKRNPARLLRLE